MQKKIEKKFLVFQIIASKLATLNCLHEKENTSPRHSVC